MTLNQMLLLSSELLFFSLILSLIALLLQELFDTMTINKFSVVYQQERKKTGYWSKQTATFFDVRDAMLWERYVKELGCKNVEIVPILS